MYRRPMAFMIGKRAGRISSDRVSSLTHPICVIGMGRSGTSLTTALIGLLGVYLGPKERMLEAAEHDNARGYWEQREIYEINEEILETFGGSWERPPYLPVDWEHSPALEGARDRALTLLTEMFGDSNRRWGWKDPRTAITLPLWRELIGEMDYVLCVRNPADVAGSLAARKSHDLDFHGSVALWHHYIRATLDNTRGGRRLILNYEDYFLQPDRQIERLSEFLWGQGAHPSDEVRERLKRFVEPELWHNRDPGDGVDRVRTVSREAANLYSRLSVSSATRRRRRWIYDAAHNATVERHPR